MRRILPRPERRRVTVCIAAACDMKTDEPKLVLCADGLMSGGLGKTDGNLKIRAIPVDRGWHILTAGRSDEIAMMTEIIRGVFGALPKGTPIYDPFVTDALRAALRARKSQRADEVIGAQYGLTYERLLEVGAAQLPEDVYREALQSVREIAFETELILAGFEHHGFPLIAEVSQAGRVSIQENFTAIGAGALLAQSMLLHRQYNDQLSLSQTLYSVYEAKKYAEGEISVGPSTHILVCHSDGRCSGVTRECFDWLEERYVELGPKGVPETLAMPDDAIYAITDPLLDP